MEKVRLERKPKGSTQNRSKAEGRTTGVVEYSEVSDQASFGGLLLPSNDKDPGLPPWNPET